MESLLLWSVLFWRRMEALWRLKHVGAIRHALIAQKLNYVGRNTYLSPSYGVVNTTLGFFDTITPTRG